MTMNPSSIADDLRLRDKCVAGDRDAAETFVRRYSDLVYRSIQHTLRMKHIRCNRDDLEDLHNGVFLNLFDHRCRRLRRYQGKNGCSLATWIRLIAVRTVLNQVRKKGPDSMRGARRSRSLEELQEIQDTAPGTWAQLEKAEQVELMAAGIRELPARYRLFFKLHFEQGLSLQEVATAMQLSPNNVHTVKHRAIKKLRDYVIAVLPASPAR